jgi:PAS domain S-box-containing protein
MDEFLFLDGSTLTATHLRDLFDHMPVGIQLFKAIRKDNKIVNFESVMVNNTAGQFSGVNAGAGDLLDIAGKNPARFRQMLKVMETGVDYFLTTVREVRGSIRWFNESMIKFADGVMIYTQDITEQKKIELRVKEDNLFVNQVTDLSADIIYIMDLSTYQLVYTNRSIAEKLGYSREQVQKMKNSLLDLIHEDDLPRMHDHLREIKNLPDDKMLEIEYRMRNAKGEYRWFCDRDTVFRRNKEKIPVEKLGICQDINERKKREEQRRTNLSIIQQAEEIAGIGAWEYDLVTNEFKWSVGMYRLFELPAREPVKPEIYLHFAAEQDKPVAKRIVKLIREGTHSFDETIGLQLENGVKKIVKIKAVPAENGPGTPGKIIGVDLDITQQVNAGYEISQLNHLLQKQNSELQELNKEIKLFNKVAIHDYRQLLMQVYSNLEYLVNNEARKLNDSGRANIRRAQAAVQKMNLIADDINNYFELFEMDFGIGPVDANSILAEVMALYHGRLQEVDGEIKCEKVSVLYSHPVLLTRLLSQLVRNSINMRNPQVPLRIHISYSFADELNALPGAVGNTSYCIISVSDNGMGYDPMEIKKIFDPFHSQATPSGRKGPGIRLAVCRKIMKMHNGFINVETEPGAGTTFKCYFPVLNDMTDV